MIKGTFTVSGADIDKMVIGSLRVNSSATWRHEFHGTIIIVADEFPNHILADSHLSHTVIIQLNQSGDAHTAVTILTAGGREQIISEWSLERKSQKQLFEKIEELFKRSNYTWTPLVQEKITQQL